MAQIIPTIVHEVFEGDEDPIAIRAYSRFDHWLSEEEAESSFMTGEAIRTLYDYEIVASFELRFVRFIVALREVCPLHLIHTARGTVARAPIDFSKLFFGYRKYIERSQTMSFYAPKYQLVIMLSHDFTILVFGAQCNVLVELDLAAEQVGLHTLPVQFKQA